MKKTKIDWCDCTINPVVGCKNGCKYCYAKKINDRFHFVKDWNEPEFFPERLEQLKSKKPKSIFMDSMSDFGWWEENWCDLIYSAMRANKQHKYILLTKGYGQPQKMFVWRNHDIFMTGKQNFYLGKTVDKNEQFNIFEQYDFLSIEPILEPIDLKGIEHNLYIKQVIIGAETGNRKGKVIPKKEWIEDIVNACDNANVRVFMKESLRSIMGADFRQDKLIWEIGNENLKTRKSK